MAGRWKSVQAKLLGFALRLRNVPRTIQLVRAASPGCFSLWLGILLSQAMLPVVAVFLTRLVVQRLSIVMQSPPPRDYLILVAPITAYAAVLIVTEISILASGYVGAILATKLQDHINKLVHAKSLEVDVAFYEWAEFFDHLHRAQQEATYRPVLLLQSIGALMQNTLTLVAMAGILLPYDVALPPLLAISTLPALWCVLRHGVEQYEWRQASTHQERRSHYFSWLMTSRESAAEVRLLGVGPRFQAIYSDLRTVLQRGQERLARRNAIDKLLASGIGMLISAAGVIWILRRALLGMASLADIAFFYHAFREGQRMMYSILHHVGELYYNTLFLGDLFEFLALKPTIVDGSPTHSHASANQTGFELKNVTFAYPAESTPVLRNFNLSLPAGTVVAIVGPNGAGKSTLVKLLCRLYDPHVGQVRIGDQDYRRLSLADLRSRITVLCQKSAQFSASVYENIAWGCPNRTVTIDEVKSAAHAAAADEFIEQLPRQYDEALGFWMSEGRELSVGQWQRIALARAIMRRTDLLILDEPTSAMDPWAEEEWMRHFQKISQGKSVLLITHRFTTAMRAHVIHVMVNGEILESGSHQELLTLNGRYATAWRSQVGIRIA